MNNWFDTAGKITALLGVGLTLFTIWNNGRQARRQKSVELIADYLSPEFRVADRYLRRKFPEDLKEGLFDFSRALFTSAGQTTQVQQLDGTMQSQSLNLMIDVVANYYNKLGVLLAMNVLDEQIVLVTLGHDAVATWNHIGPVLRRQDAVREDQSVSYMGGFQYLVQRAQRTKIRGKRKLSYKRDPTLHASL